ncbi:MAG: Smc, chromosome segregation ATPase, chromosome segregation protein [Parcubacteria group bacterium]|nr:Smc, chromosome segregation ATPase, chromosome segregation protein [Parcubacteria group bacterium]
MYLKSIELSGFKSFAKKSELLFTSPISSIVGPNGSGKSNVAEAFRFVLGEQSIKSLRGKKGEDLIFNGAGGESRSNRASVKVTFDNSNKVFGIDYPEVSIERVVHRDGINDYFINGSAVRLKDVIELLLKAHIGASGHHIISQGEADKILNSSGKDRKSMIEDALGLRLYQYKRIESDRKLKKTFENIAQVESLRKEIAPHLRFLKKQVEKMEKALGMREELARLSKEYFRREDLYVGFTKTAQRDERTPIDEKLALLSKELETAKAVLARAGEENKKGYLILDLEAEMAGARAHKDGLARELGKLEGSLDAEERIIRKQKELQTSDEHKMIRLKDVEEFARTLEQEIEKDHHILGTVIARIRDFIKGHKDSADSSLIVDAEKAIEHLKHEKEKVEHEIEKASAKELALREKYDAEKARIEKEKDSSRDAEKAVFRIMSEENDLLAKLVLIRSREENIKKDEAELVRDVEEVAAVIGHEVLQFKTFDIGSESEAVAEDRAIQENRKREIERLKIRLEEAGISGTDEVVKEFTEANERDEFLARELLDLEKSAESLKVLIQDLEERLQVEFATGIKRINTEFGELFSTMFGGGDAELVLTKEKKKKKDALLEGEDVELEGDDEDEIVEEGLDISVNLPRKKIRGLMMLSGGERALTSIALLFAISQVNPPPFIILDETDAALDEANSKRYGDMVEKLAEHSQLILITHNRETMSRAGVIYGVTMGSTGVSKLLSIEFDQAVQVAK